MASSRPLLKSSGRAQQELDFGGWQATGFLGFPQNDGSITAAGHEGRPMRTALVAQVGPDEFVVTGIDSSISFHLPGKLAGQRMQILSAEQGQVMWMAPGRSLRLWNGDETDRGLSFHRRREPVVSPRAVGAILILDTESQNTATGQDSQLRRSADIVRLSEALRRQWRGLRRGRDGKADRGSQEFPQGAAGALGASTQTVHWPAVASAQAAAAE